MRIKESINGVEFKRLGLTILIVLALSFVFPVLAPGAGVGLLLGGTYIYKKSGKWNVKNLSALVVAAGVFLLALVSYYLVCMSVVDSETINLEATNGGITNYTAGIYGENRLGQKQ